MDTILELLTGNTLTRLVFFPTIACLPLLFFPRSAAKGVKVYTLIVSLIELAFALQLLFTHLGPDGTFPLVDEGRYTWIQGFGIRY
ncbi:MAG: hypothetical protein ACLGI9_13605, partial [Thermoanaerobaculia bacterium]